MKKKYESLRAARKAKKLTLVELGELVEADATNLSRIERGVQTPSRDLARRLYEQFEGRVPLGAIYDPAHGSKGFHVTD